MFSYVFDVAAATRQDASNAACRERGRAFGGLFLFISLFHEHKTATMVGNWNKWGY